MAKTTIEIPDEYAAELDPYRDKLGELLSRTRGIIILENSSLLCKHLLEGGEK
jgi:hypothetical protein